MYFPLLKTIVRWNVHIAISAEHADMMRLVNVDRLIKYEYEYGSSLTAKVGTPNRNITTGAGKLRGNRRIQSPQDFFTKTEAVVWYGSYCNNLITT